MTQYIYDRPYRPHRTHRIRRGLALLAVLFVTTAGFVLVRDDSNPVGRVLATTEKPSISSGTIGEQAAVWKANIEQAGLLASTNAMRTQAGLVPLALSTQLTASASAKCKDMVLKDYWSHNDPEGREPWHFIDESGYLKQAAGENLAYGFSDNSGVVKGWMNSPTHRATLLDPNYLDVGFGICDSSNFVGTGRQTIVVQHFGRTLP